MPPVKRGRSELCRGILKNARRQRDYSRLGMPPDGEKTNNGRLFWLLPECNKGRNLTQNGW